MKPRPELYETEAETKTNYCETEINAGLETVTSLEQEMHKMCAVV